MNKQQVIVNPKINETLNLKQLLTTYTICYNTLQLIINKNTSDIVKQNFQ